MISKTVNKLLSAFAISAAATAMVISSAGSSLLASSLQPVADPSHAALLERFHSLTTTRSSARQEADEREAHLLPGSGIGLVARLDPSQRDALTRLIQEQLRRCWDAPQAALRASNPPVASIRFALNLDGSLVGQPQVVNDSPDPLFRAVADSATRATRRCSPFQISAQFVPYYEDWKNMTVNFNPRW